jgi:5'-phosphate synthase pdxT subunit
MPRPNSNNNHLTILKTNMKNITIGILGLQGAFHKHQQLLESLSVNTLIVKYPEQLEQCDGLIIPGGESTTMTKLIRQMSLFESIKQYNKPIFGTCAGAILLSQNSEDTRIDNFDKVPVTTIRNAYGRQVESFIEDVELNYNNTKFPAVFIRAPKFKHLNSSIEVMASLNNEPIFLKYKNIILTSFHPELTNNTSIHQYFINIIVN